MGEGGGRREGEGWRVGGGGEESGLRERMEGGGSVKKGGRVRG